MILDNSSIASPGSEMGFDNRLGLGLVLYVWQINKETLSKILFKRQPWQKGYVVQGVPDVATT